MLRCFAVVVIGMVVACTGSSPASDGGQKCIGASYDPCNTEHDCANMNCKPFSDIHATICTQACTPGDTSCPPQNGSAVACNAAGMCEPAAANTCKIQ